MEFINLCEKIIDKNKEEVFEILMILVQQQNIDLADLYDATLIDFLI